MFGSSTKGKEKGKNKKEKGLSRLEILELVFGLCYEYTKDLKKKLFDGRRVERKTDCPSMFCFI